MSECEEKEENRIQVYPAPAGALLQEDHLLRVRPVGAKEWQRVDVYRVKVDIQIKWNRDYNPAPGRLIENILMERISVLSGQGEEMSVICGYDEERRVKNVRISEFYRDGRRVKSLSEANIRVGEYAEGVELV